MRPALDKPTEAVCVYPVHLVLSHSLVQKSGCGHTMSDGVNDRLRSKEKEEHFRDRADKGSISS
jgi:hypothetical protein